MCASCRHGTGSKHAPERVRFSPEFHFIKIRRLFRPLRNLFPSMQATIFQSPAIAPQRDIIDKILSALSTEKFGSPINNENNYRRTIKRRFVSAFYVQTLTLDKHFSAQDTLMKLLKLILYLGHNFV